MMFSCFQEQCDSLQQKNQMRLAFLSRRRNHDSNTDKTLTQRLIGHKQRP